jgi:hypothetical protein
LKIEKIDLPGEIKLLDNLLERGRGGSMSPSGIEIYQDNSSGWARHRARHWPSILHDEDDYSITGCHQIDECSNGKRGGFFSLLFFCA